MDPFTDSSRRPALASAAPPSPVQKEEGGILKKLEELKKDDYILIGIIAVLFLEGSEDYILMAALGYLFVMGIL